MGDNVASTQLSLSNHLPLQPFLIMERAHLKTKEIYVQHPTKRRLPPNALQRNVEADPLPPKCLNFSGNIKVKKEEVENKKLKILQEMNEEKKAFWSNLLEVMKTSKK